MNEFIQIGKSTWIFVLCRSVILMECKKKHKVTMNWNTAGILAWILIVVLYIWLIILASGTHSSSSSDGWKNFAIATFVIGTLVTGGILTAVWYI